MPARDGKPLNAYGDSFTPTEGHGVDISSQRSDALDDASLDFIRTSEGTVTAVDLGGGFGAHALKMARAGANVLMIDVSDMRGADVRNEGANPAFLQKDMAELTPADLPEKIDLLYSQRAIHYVPYDAAVKTLRLLHGRMPGGGSVFISAAGWNTEYGKTYPDRDKPVEQRFGMVAPDMQEKHGILHRIVTYKEDELAQLLEQAGFSDIAVTTSTFGNIKAIARKKSS